MYEQIEIDFNVHDPKTIIALARTFDCQGHLGGTVTLNEVELIKFTRCLVSILSRQSEPHRRAADNYAAQVS